MSSCPVEPMWLAPVGPIRVTSGNPLAVPVTRIGAGWEGLLVPMTRMSNVSAATKMMLLCQWQRSIPPRDRIDQ